MQFNDFSFVFILYLRRSCFRCRKEVQLSFRMWATNFLILCNMDHRPIFFRLLPLRSTRSMSTMSSIKSLSMYFNEFFLFFLFKIKIFLRKDSKSKRWWHPRKGQRFQLPKRCVWKRWRQKCSARTAEELQELFRALPALNTKRKVRRKNFYKKKTPNKTNRKGYFFSIVFAILIAICCRIFFDKF